MTGSSFRPTCPLGDPLTATTLGPRHRTTAASQPVPLVTHSRYRTSLVCGSSRTFQLDAFDSRGVTINHPIDPASGEVHPELLRSSGPAHVVTAVLESGGIIGRHPATETQLLMVVSGELRISGDDDQVVELGAPAGASRAPGVCAVEGGRDPPRRSRGRLHRSAVAAGTRGPVAPRSPGGPEPPIGSANVDGVGARSRSGT